MPTKTWVAGEEMLAADINAQLQQQVVATFATAAARSTALPSPLAGMVTWRNDAGVLEVWTGTVWRELGAALGRLGTKAVAGALGALTGFLDLTAGGITITAYPGRIYRTSTWGSTFTSGGANQKSVQIQLWNKIGAGSNVQLALLGLRINLDAGVFALTTEYQHSGAVGPVTFGVAGGAEQGGTSISSTTSIMTLDDVGHA